MSTADRQDRGGKRTAGAYDVRVFIAGLIGLYGIVLVLMGLFDDSADDKAKTGDVNANLWAGLVMIVVAIAFAVWTKLRPVVVEPRGVDRDAAETQDDSPVT
jgi:uncharacterized membrane protein